MISHAEEVAGWLERRFWLRRLGAAIYLVLMPAYLVWLVFLFNRREPLLATLFILANVIDFILGLILIFFTWHHPRRPPRAATRPYSLDVFVPVYTEPLEMIELTMRAARDIEVPHETYLLDDGPRTEVRDLARRLGIHYIVRSDRTGAKAGNLNSGLRHSRGELVAVFDADHIPQREGLATLVGHFDDPAVALVQTPQFYYNEDALTYQVAHRSRNVAAGPWNEQALYYDLFQQGRDAFNAMSSVGTCVVYRRKALEEIGGFPEKTVTEDLHTSLLLHRRGWRFVHVNEPIAWGLAAADLDEFYRTRHRWAHGNLQVIRHENVLFCGGLSWWQRLSYLGLSLYTLEAWQQILYLLIPIWILFLSVSPITINLWSASLIPFCVILRVASFLLIGGGYVRFVDDQVVSLGRMPIILVAWWGITGRPMVWKTSGKNGRARISPGLLAPQIAIVAVNSLVVLTVAIQLLRTKSDLFLHLYIYSFSLVWVLFNIWKAGQWILKTIRAARRAHDEYRFEAPLPILDEAGQHLGHFTRVATTAGEAVLRDGAVQGNGGPLAPGATIQVLFPGHCVRARLDAVERAGGQWQLAFRFDDEDSLWRLRQSLYSVDWHRQIRLAPFCTQTLQRNLGGVWRAACLSPEDAGPHWAALQAPDEASAPRHLMATALLQAGDEITVTYLKGGRVRKDRFRIGRPLEDGLKIPRDLNDQDYRLFTLDGPGSVFKFGPGSAVGRLVEVA